MDVNKLCFGCMKEKENPGQRCPYCGFEFQTDYDDEIDEIECPECGQIFDIEWDDDDSDDSPNDN